MGARTTIQIALIVISVIIIATFINPKFQVLKATQDETVEYQEALDNANSFQSELQRLQTQIDSFSFTQLSALETYLPDTVDPVVVMRDLAAIAEQVGLDVTSLATAEGFESRSANSVAAQGQAFEEERSSVTLATTQVILGVIGDYEQLKNFLNFVEQNKYPLRVTAMSFTASGDVLFSVEFTIETYSLATS